MNTRHLSRVLTATMNELSNSESLQGLMHQHRNEKPLPWGRVPEEIIEQARSILLLTINHGSGVVI